MNQTELPEAPRQSPLTDDTAQPSREGGPMKRFFWIGAAVALGVLLFAVTGDDDVAPEIVPDVPRVEGERILFSSNFAERVGIQITPVRVGPLTPVVSVVGTVTLDPAHVAAVGTRLKGLVRSMRRFEGDEVKAGEILAEVDSAELADAQASVRMLAAEREAAKANAEREEQLFAQRLSTAREFEVAQAEFTKYNALLKAAQQRVLALGGDPNDRRAVMGRHLLRSPINGTIIDRNIATGQSVVADHVAFRIANLDHLWVELAVYEQNLGSIRIGDQVTLKLLSDPEVAIDGRVAHIGAQVHPETRSADVRVEVDNRERKLIPGQAVTAEILATRNAGASVLVVPRSAVTVVDGQPTVFVADGENAVRIARVTLGKGDDDEQQVIEGLSPEDSVVSSGVFALKSELFR